MATNETTYMIDSSLLSVRTPEVPNADWTGGGNHGASNAPGLGINTGNYDPKLQDWPRPAAEAIQDSQVIGGVPSGLFAIDATFGANALVAFVETGGAPVAADAVIKDVGGFDIVNRTGDEIPANTWVWGVANNP